MSLTASQPTLVQQAKQAALEVLVHNLYGPHQNLPRTAGWGYPEPYTRDLMLSTLGVLVSNHAELIHAWQEIFQRLARNQSDRGLIPGLVHDRTDCGSSDTTPLFILMTAIFRSATGQPDFLQKPLERALTWMQYQSPSDRILVGQLPTSDWRDEQWIMGYGLYVNTLVYSYLRVLGQFDRADRLKKQITALVHENRPTNHPAREGLRLAHKPYYAAWSYKVLYDDRFDLLGNCLAILSGLTSTSRARRMVSWVESQSQTLRQQGDLRLSLPPCYFPYIEPQDPDWRTRYARYNRPGEYHNGGIWPFVCGLYIAAVVASGNARLAKKRLLDLTALVKPARTPGLSFGFNEWFKAQDATPRGQDWQTWSAAMYLYAAACVEENRTPYFDRTS